MTADGTDSTEPIAGGAAPESFSLRAKARQRCAGLNLIPLYKKFPENRYNSWNLGLGILQ